MRSGGKLLKRVKVKVGDFIYVPSGTNHAMGKVAQHLTKDFLQVNVIAGSAVITVDENNFSAKKGSHFILPNTVKECELSGKAEFVVSHT